MATVHIDVMLRDEILDPQGQAVERALPTLGFAEVESVRIGKHIVVELADEDDLEARVEAMCGELLANPVIEQYAYRIER